MTATDGRGARSRTGDRVPLSTQVYEELRRSIINGELPSQTELKQVELAKRFGVSTIPVREAIRQLHAEGLVDSQPFLRARVRGLSIEQLGELLHLREELEVIGVQLHGPELTDERLDALDALNDRLATTTDGEDWLRGDWELHQLLLGDSSPTAEVVDSIRRRIHSALNAAHSFGARHEKAVGEHRAIIAALRARDPEGAEAALRAHVQRTATLLLDHARARQATAAG